MVYIAMQGNTLRATLHAQWTTAEQVSANGLSRGQMVYYKQTT